LAEGEAGETEGGVALRDTWIIIYVRLPYFSPDRVTKPAFDLGDSVKYNTSNLILPHTHDPRYARQPCPLQSTNMLSVKVRCRLPVSKSIPILVADPIDPPDGSWLYGTGGKLKWRTSTRQRHRYRSLPLPPVIFLPTATSHFAMRRLYISTLFSLIPSSSYVSHPFCSPERRVPLPLSSPHSCQSH